MPVTAVRLVRRMRGGAQAQLLAAGDGRHYVTKFLGNPQHRRILVNEWICSRLFQYLQIAVPACAVVEVDAGLVAREPELTFQLATRSEPVQPGRHYGSTYPGHPDRQAVYDFLPDTLLRQAANRSDFLGALAADKWMGNSDARQAVFFRARLLDWIPGAASNQKGFVAQMIDHGFAFDGPHWEMYDSPLQGLYHRKLVYEEVESLESFEPWLSRIIGFPEEVLDRALREIPPEWTAGDEDALDRLMNQLLARRKRIPGLLELVARGPQNPFPHWNQGKAWRASG
jgi:hypothetical protein